jgi:aminoglycoside phosphotransferase (APT) family kinase protein
MNATIARLHSLDPAAIGLGDYGRPAAFVERQVARWSKQYLADSDAGRVPQMDALVDWLGKHLPPDRGEARIVHGDFRCDNMIFAPPSRASSRCSTGNCRRSAIRSPTSSIIC